MRQATFAPSKKRPGSTPSAITRDQPRARWGRPGAAAGPWLTLDFSLSNWPFKVLGSQPQPVHPSPGAEIRYSRPGGRKIPVFGTDADWTFVLVPDEGFALST